MYDDYFDDELPPDPANRPRYERQFAVRRFFRVAIKLNRQFRAPLLKVVDNASSGCLDRDLWLVVEPA